MNLAVDTTTRAGRMFSAGRVTVTFVSPTGSHITLTAKCRGKVDGKWAATNLAAALVVFVEVPNETGFNDKVGRINSRGGFQPDPNADPARVWCANQLLRLVAGQDLAPGLEAKEEERCGKCGRALTDPVSIDRGIGPECYGKETGSSHEKKAKPADGLTWREKKEAIAEAREERTGKSSPRRDTLVANSSQMQTLPGTTWEDIFEKREEVVA